MGKFSFWWIILSVLIFFGGIFLSSTSVLTGNKTIGTVFLATGMVSILTFVFYSISQWFQFKKGHGLKNLITAYVFLAFLFVFGGLIGAFLTFPEGLTYFIVGVAMLGFYYVVKLIKVLTMKEEDFQ